MIWPTNARTETHAEWPALLDEDAVDDVLRCGQQALDRLPAASGTRQARPDLPPALLQQLWEAIQAANHQHFHFDVIGIAQLIYVEYPTGSYVSAHLDRSYGYKLSLSVQLSPAEAYTGGDLRLVLGAADGSLPVVAPRARGDGIVFPSYVLHEVTPVTSGVRQALVAWCLGPRFR